MKSCWHEAVQRYLDRQSSTEEAAALHEALNRDAELRTLYLDYMNLDAALGSAAAAAVNTEIGIDRTVTFPRPAARSSPHYWRWLAATAAGAALVMFAVLPRHRNSSRALPDLAATISSTQNAIARLSVEVPSSLPAWMSPTASMLDQPRFPR
jgi:hypothetical protein